MKTYEKYFEGKEELLGRLELLHEKKMKLKELMDKRKLDSYVVELCGLPRTGKTVSTERVFSFFKYGKIDAKVAEEPAFLVKNSVSNEELANMTKVDFNDKTLEVSKANLEKLKSKNIPIILMDRGVIDNYFWYQMMYEDGIITKEVFERKMESFEKDLSDIDELYMLTADPEVIIQRDYANEIYLDNRNKTTLEGVTKLKSGYEHLFPMIKYMKKNGVYTMDTSSMAELDTPIMIADSIMDNLILKYENK